MPKVQFFAFLFIVSMVATVGPARAIDPNCTGTPIVVTLDPRGFGFTSLENGVTFDLDADGFPDQTSWTDPDFDQGFLALDRDENGRIDHGAELFGADTSQPASAQRNGYEALAVFDLPENGGNADGFITSVDPIFSELVLWFDENHDGVSENRELVPLGHRGIRALDLSYQTIGRRDRHGNHLRWTSFVHFEDSRKRAAVDVVFLLR